MRLSRTLGVGAALAAVPLVIGLGLTIDRLQTLSAKSEQLMLRQLAAVRLGTGVVVRLDRLSEYARKYAVSHDGAYANKANEVRSAISSELNSIVASGVEDDAVAAFAHKWQSSHAATANLDGDADVIADDITALTLAAQELLARAHQAAEADVAAAEQARSEAVRASLSAFGVAVVVSASVFFVVVRRVRRRLEDFVDATVAVSHGAFSLQLPEASHDELGRAAQAFNQMVTALAQLERLKADFISSISHELRTPLVAMVETNDALLDDVAGPLTEQQRRMISLNHGAAQRLHSMINDLLELSVVRSGLRYRMATVMLGDVVRDGCSELEARASDHGIHLAVDLDKKPAAVYGDSSRLLQVTQNLVDNAIKYTPRDGHVAVSVRIVEPATLQPPTGRLVEAKHFAHMRVDDSGPGVPDDDRERIFEKFFRRQGVSADGVGLGLAITREIVLAHRGTIWVETSDALGGASFHVAIPLEAA